MRALYSEWLVHGRKRLLYAMVLSGYKRYNKKFIIVLLTAVFSTIIKYK